MGVMTRSPSVVSGDYAGYGTTLRRHKSVGGGPMWVDEATTTVFREFDEMVKTHRLCYKTETTGMVRI